MANQVALAVMSRPGTEVAAPNDVHILGSEAGAAAVISGLQIRTLGLGAAPELALWEEAAGQPGNDFCPRVSVFALENTHNRSGRFVLEAAYTDRVIAVARHDVACHLDGARLLNAAVALGETSAKLAGGFDTVFLSLNNSLAPLGVDRAAAIVRQTSRGWPTSPPD
jgi:threonine aldolase